MDNARAMSFAQERLWFLDQLRPGAADYLLPLGLHIRGKLDVDALTGTFQAIVDRHEVLRTRYVAVDGMPAAVVDEHVEATVEHTDDGDVLRREVGRPFDLAAGPPFRITLARLGDDDHLVVFVVHHIAFDGWSWSVLARELADGYRERTTIDPTDSEPADTTPPALGYAEFAKWQRDRFTGERGRRQLDYWRAQLDDLPALELPTDRPRPKTRDGSGDVVRFESRDR